MSTPSSQPLALTDQQLSQLMSYAAPLAPSDRNDFVERVALELRGVELKPETIRNTIARVQSEFMGRAVGSGPRRRG